MDLVVDVEFYASAAQQDTAINTETMNVAR